MFLHVPVLNIFIRSTAVYCFVLVLLRLSGKRHIGQMTPVDLVLLLLISNAVQNAMTGPDTSLLGGVVAAGTLLLTNWLLFKTMRHSPFFRRWLEGTPTLLINNGQIIQAHLDREGIDHDEMLQALRAHGVATIQDVRLAVLEMDGTISVVKNEDITSEHPSRPYHRIKYIRHNA